MNFYINTDTLEYPLSATQIVVANPGISFPVPFAPPPGYEAVVEIMRPTYDPGTQRVAEMSPKHDGQVWTQVWRVIALTADELAVRAGDQAASLAVTRSKLWTAIKAERDRRGEVGGYKVVVGGVDKWFHSDPKSRVQQLGLVIAGAAVPAAPWKTMDGTYVTLSQALVMQIFSAAMAQELATFANAFALQTAVNTAADPASVNIAAGWPAIFTTSSVT